MRTFNFGKTAAVCLAAVLIIALSVSAYAYGTSIYGWGRNMEIRDDGDGTVVYVHTQDMTEPVEFEDGRMIFVVNGEHIDISDIVSVNEAYRYRFTDSEGYTHDWLVGLNEENNIENYGYAEYVSDADGNWRGGYSARVNTERDGSSKPWLDNAKKEMNCPW